MVEHNEILTHEEHQARAMLMGLMYDWRDGTYCLPRYPKAPSAKGMIDCLTLEPLWRQATPRDHTDLRSHNLGKYEWNDPPHITPWGKP